MGTVHAKVDHKYYFGEDETGLFDMDETLDLEEQPVPKSNFSLTGVRARVDRVNIDGLNRTKDDVIRGTVDDLFQAEDFEDVIMRANKVRQALDNLGCFGHICVFIDVSSGPDATPNGLEVTFQVRELNRVEGAVNGEVGEDEGSIVLGMKFPNLFGRGERAAAAYSLGYRSTSNFHLTASKPLHFKQFSPVLSGSVYQQNQEFPWSGYRLFDRGVLLDAAFSTSPGVKHHLQWEGLLRDVTVLNKTSFKVRESSGPQLKSVVRHSVTLEQRDEAMFPTRGVWLQLSNELAGLGGSVGNLKAEVRAQANHTLSEDDAVVLQATCAMGVLVDLFSTELPDHFFLGGPTTLRGFQQRGVGPHQDGQAIGGRLYWAGGLHVYSRLPLMEARGGLGGMLRTHLFVNAGCLALPERRSLSAAQLVESVSEARASCGAGVCVRLGRAARLELNYVVPLRALHSDRPLTGLQLGLGADFL